MATRLEETARLVEVLHLMGVCATIIEAQGIWGRYSSEVCNVEWVPLPPAAELEQILNRQPWVQGYRRGQGMMRE